ncbi:hypothetical protein A3C87_01700 [Candidatus Kaiserbacteria bacterium RIFCSPHIGHO2_02_FULL_49_34]|uniref:AI-2E family transporter n=1 Tax=Candidatus Kaiserbacteria bacterium RIFCSPHIGHO2_02_FULL_49_34 TaxID=1798491 RepID=A0A1F6DL94_9BACT|nr:MAG: hypothetical protein A3C87_01700 [Candidatus Kaiserbacteria bacterium RIFCSPHIGHO2_02_FULL_49_34]
MSIPRLVEYGFLFLLLAAVGYVAWKVFAPFVGVLALSVVITVLAYPFYERLHYTAPWRNYPGVNAFLTVLGVYTVIIGATAIFAAVILREARAIYAAFNDGGTETFGVYMQNIEHLVRVLIPDFTINIADLARNTAGIVASNISSLFASTATTIALLFLSMLISFYLLRDGKQAISYLISVSPLNDIDDRKVLDRIVGAIRGIIFGVMMVAIIQAVMTMLGLTIFGVERAVLFGFIAAFAALIPGVGPGLFVFVPLTIYLVATGQYMVALGVGVWGFLAVGTIDNILGPLLMRRGGTSLHPLVILLSALGGITAFGLIGFVIGPVIMSIFVALLEIYSDHIAKKRLENERVGVN